MSCLVLLGALLGCQDKGAQPASGAAAASGSAAPNVPVHDDASGWAVVVAGSFVMGSPKAERCRNPDEEPVKVTLTQRFVIQAREVTQRAFHEVMGYNPSFRRACDTCPVDSVTHHEAQAYCNALSVRRNLPSCYRCTGQQKATRCKALAARPVACQGYRLPTEAEWEYATRAGTQTATYAGDLRSCMRADRVADGVAWYKVSSRGQSQPVAQKQANAWGLFDMLGNVYEWTADWYAPRLNGGKDPLGPESGSERVLRGGSWYHNAEHARSANRHAFRPEKRLSYVGFRCAHSLDD